MRARGFPLVFGNDTIDCYPLGEGGIRKILVVSEQKFQELEKEFQSFFQGVRGRLAARSSLPGANREGNCRLKPPAETFAPKFAATENPGHFRDYEPSNAIYLNTCEWRRWVRVKEWFNQYAQGAEEQILEKGV